MPTILIAGYYGAGNIGDEAILISIINELRAQKPVDLDLSFVVLSWNPEKTSRELDVGAIHWKDIDALVDHVQNTDLIIVGGGGIFHDYWGIDPNTYLRKSSWDITAFGSLPLLAKLLEIPCMIYAVGVGPFQSALACEHTRLAFERCQIATVRDVESLECLKQTGFDIQNSLGPLVKILPDPVYSLQTSSEEELQVLAKLRDLGISDDQSILGVSIHYWDIETTYDDWLANLANGLREFLLANPQLDLVTIPFHVFQATPFTNDAIVLQQMTDLMDMPERVHLINESLSPGFAQALIKRSDLIVGMRLHSVIMGVNVATPMVALASRPKVFSAMKMIGLEDFCIRTLMPPVDDLVLIMQQAWNKREDIQKQLNVLRKSFSNQTKENASLALDLLSKAKRRPLDFSQKFALKQTKLLFDVDETYEELEKAKKELNERLQTRIWDLQAVESDLTNQNAELLLENNKLNSQNAELLLENAKLKEALHAIQSTRVWQLGQRYYRLRDSSILRYPYYFAATIKREGIKAAIRKAKDRQLIPIHPQLPVDDVEAKKKFQPIISMLNSKTLNGVFVLTSAFEFDEFYNQRVINLAKFLVQQGWGVVYVAWVWHESDELPMGEVMENIFQIPSSVFLRAYEELNNLSVLKKFFVIEFPYPAFLSTAIRLRKSGFYTIYDIIDEWEEFHKVGQALWFNKAAEEALVINANVLSAVSQPLVEKFSYLRKDIHLIPNGFDPKFLGNHQGDSQKKFAKGRFNLGYFGHLTPSWFDWEFIKETIRHSLDEKIDLHLHLIGYGEPDIEELLGEYQDHFTFYGKVHPSDLNQYVKDWDAAMIPFISGKLSEAVDPIKIYEYLYFGLPVIVKGITHLESLPNVEVVVDSVEFINVLKVLRSDKTAKLEPVNLSKHTWEERFTKLLDLLKDKTWMPL